MKTEISRDSHLPAKRYSGVYQQQGRMLTDADWNELVDILKDRLDDALKDVVGNKHSSVGGTPRHRALKITKSTGSPLAIESGHVYVDGHHAEAAADPVKYPDDTPPPKTFDYDKQLDFPSPPALPTTPESYVVYADIWERTVTHLMDDDLRDQGLHGADTCTRKQMMAQVKWCPVGNVPEQYSKNPPKGDSSLTVTLLQKSTEPDPCDPCTAELDVESKVGNYLFRVEVHDVEGDADSATKVILKWSSENGAEQYRLKNDEGDDLEPPDSFKNGNWAYEFFDEISERHMGVHLDSGFSPSREELSAGYPTTPQDRDFVRSWDGFCVLKKDGGNWTIEKDTDGTILGMDKGAPLQDADSNALGYITIETGADGSSRLVATLTNTQIDLTLTKESSGSIQDCAFVAGDFWLADVREIEHKPGSVLIEDKPPQGIEHHYLTLGTVSAGDLDDNPEADRKYAFPPLTERTRLFQAGGDGQEIVPGNPLPQPLRVGVANGEWTVEGAEVRFQVVDFSDNLIGTETTAFTNPEGIAEFDWTPDSAIDATNRVKATLVDPHDTTQDLDHPPVYFYANLVTADQVAYEPGCPDSGENAVHSLLAQDGDVSLDLGPDNYYTVAEVLDALLCELGAKHIPYDPTIQDSRWGDINDDDSRPGNVQDALDNLVENLESSDIKYEFPTCVETPGVPTFKSLIEGSVQNKFTEGGKTKSKIEDLWDALLCHLDAAKLPYNSVNKGARWDDINSEEVDPRPTTVQNAIDNLADNLHSEDIKYKPNCPGETPTSTSVRSKLGISKTSFSRINQVLNKLLCDFNATHLPIDRSADLCNTLKENSGVKTVQDAINAVCRNRGTCSVTVGKGGVYATLEKFFESAEYKKATHISICLLPRGKGAPHTIDGQEVSGKHSFSMTGNGNKILIRKKLVVKAIHIHLSGIRFSAVDKDSEGGRGTGTITLSPPEDGHVVVENCRFSRVANGTDPDERNPLVTVDNLANLKWTGNRMDAVLQDEEIREAVMPKKELIPGTSLDTYDKLKKLWFLNPHEDPEDYEVKATEVAETLKGLPGETRKKWYNHRKVGLIGNLPDFDKFIRRRPIGRTIGGLPGSFPTSSLPMMRESAPPVTEVIGVSTKKEVESLFALINSTDPIDTLNIAAKLHNISYLINKPDYALALSSNRVWGWITNNDFYGYVALYNGENKTTDRSWDSTESVYKEAWATDHLHKSLSTEGQMNISGNQFTAVRSVMNEEALAAIRRTLTSGHVTNGFTIQAYESLTVRDNTFYEAESSFIGGFINIAGNHFPFKVEEDILAHVLGFSGVFLGNQALENEKARIDQTLTWIKKAANLLSIV